MIRVALLGCDSSHTEAYAELLNLSDLTFGQPARVESLWGEDSEEARRKAAAYEIPHLTGTPEAAIEVADLVMVIGRYGDSHYTPARLAIEEGKPVFVDKPMTNDAIEALELMQLARDRGTPLASFSPFRFSPEVERFRKELSSLSSPRGAFVSSPADCALLDDPRAMELHFYGIHALELLFVSFGSDVRWVSATRSDRSIWATLGYADGRHAALNLMVRIGDFYHVVVSAPDEARTVQVDPYGPIYERSLRVLLGPFLDGNAAMAPVGEAVRAIAVLDAIEHSLEEGRPIEIREIVGDEVAAS